MTQLIIIRHGETFWNTERRHMGHLNSPLTPKGEAQARAVAERLKGFRFDALYSSDLGRAIQTAEAIAAATGHNINIDERLRERNIGLFQGLNRIEAEEQHPEHWQDYQDTSNTTYTGHKGESFQQLYDRAQAVLDYYAKAHPEQTVVLVSHGSFLKNVCKAAIGLPPANERTLTCKNTALGILNFANGRWTVETWGDTAHLRDIIS